MRSLWVVAGLLIFFSSAAHSLQLTENFSSGLNWDTAHSTGVWNGTLGYIHPPIAIDSTSAVGVNENAPPIDVGTGSDGPFDTTTYALFSVGGSTPSNTITIDTSVHPSLQFT